MSRAARPCPSRRELSRGFRSLPAEELRRHLEVCPRCRAEWEAGERLASLATDMPLPLPDAQRLEDMRTSLIAAAGETPVRPAPKTRVPWRLVGALAAGVAIVAGALGLRAVIHSPRGARAPEYHASVHRHGDARMVCATPAPDEIVRLTEGTITIEVKPLGPRERFRVVTGDGEVEVRGTVLEVTAHADRLVVVRVLSGHVRVRRMGQALAHLGPGERWTAPGWPPAAAPVAPAAHAAPQSPPSTSPTQRHAPRPARPPVEAARRDGTASASRSTSDDRAERTFAAAWEDLRAGRAADAADAFGEAMRLAPDAPLCEDASFWRAVALQRAARIPAATQAFTAFLERYRNSPRVGEASTVLGWLLLGSGDLTGAERRFVAAENDAVPRVRASAQAGLAELARRRDGGTSGPSLGHRAR